MKARHRELLDRSVSAMIAAVEVYNKPDFPYREEAFAILALNAWELLSKAKWLSSHQNKLSSLHVLEPRRRKDGAKGKGFRIKRTRSGNPFTHSLDYLGKCLVEQGSLNLDAWKNLEALTEMRDSAVHFYNRSGTFPVRLQEVAAASLKNFVAVLRQWFSRDLSEFDFFLMPLAFVSPPPTLEGMSLNNEERNFLRYVDELEGADQEPIKDYSVTVNVNVRFVRSKTKGVLEVRTTGDSNAPTVHVMEEIILERYPWSYAILTQRCRDRYPDFKENSAYHSLRSELEASAQCAKVRLLDPSNPNSSKKTFYSPLILQEFDKVYGR